MITITIPKNLTKDDLVIIPKKEYNEFLQLRKIIPMIKLTPTQKEDLEKARNEYKKGKYISLEQLEYELGITNKRKN